MPFEVVNTLATVGTFIVIAATAIAAMIQLRHLRAANQIAALASYQRTIESPQFAEARRFIVHELPAKLHDSHIRARLSQPPLDGDLQTIGVIGNFFESIGISVKSRVIDADIACDMWCGVIVQSWDAIAPALALMRGAGGDDIWENFEYLTVLAQDWMKAHPRGAYPRGTRRIALTSRR